MPLFKYKGIASTGSKFEDTIEAASRKAALVSLKTKKIQIISIRETEEKKKGFDFNFAMKRKVSSKERDLFTRQLSALLAAGIPLAPALERLSLETGSPVARETWRGIHGHVVEGVSLADAMRQYPQTFPGIYTAMVNAGETGGFIDIVLKEMAEFQERERDLKGKFMSAMIYPIVLAVICVVVVVVLMIWCIPKFEDIFADFGAGLPAMTKMVVEMSRFIQGYGFYMLAIIIAAGIGFTRWLKTETGAEKWEMFVINIPVLGNVVKRFALTRFCRMLGTLTNAGIPLLNALTVSKESIGVKTLIKMFAVSIEHVKQGCTLADGLRETGDLFSGSVLEIISIAEHTGRLDEELIHLSKEIDKDLDRELRTVVSLAEPLLLVVMAGVIGTIVVAMVLPMFSMQDYIK